MDGNNLQHHGILGMKWGIRRTDRQLGHNPSNNEVKRVSPKDRVTSLLKTKSDRPKVSDMSDKDLQERIKRLNLEKQYKQLTREKQPLATAAKVVGTTLASVVVGEIFRSYVSEIAKAGIDPIARPGVDLVKHGVSEYIDHLKRKGARKVAANAGAAALALVRDKPYKF